MPVLPKQINKIAREEIFPMLFLEATISVPKTVKNPPKKETYRPISLITIDKIFSARY